MKKRIIFLLIGFVIGLLSIEVYFKFFKKKDYYNEPYEIKYVKNDSYPEKYLGTEKYIDYYLQNYDENSYILFKDQNKIPLMEAFKLGYINLATLKEEVDILEKTSFSLEFHENKEQDLARKYFVRDLNIYYYHINDIQIIKNDKKENLLILLESGKIEFKAIMLYLENNSVVTKENGYTCYTLGDYKVYLKDQNVYFGNKDLNLKIIKD